MGGKPAAMIIQAKEFDQLKGVIPLLKSDFTS
jgi:hypothetical protein